MATSGDFSPATEGDRVLTSIVPAGLHTNLYTDRWNGALRSPLLPKTHKYVSLRLMGGRRIFRMAPIHHHYELKGWAEPKVIVRFWIISFMLVLIGLATLKLR